MPTWANIDPTAEVAEGLVPFKRISTAGTNAAVVKASPGFLFQCYVTNSNANARYLKIYNKATAPTVGTDVPVLTVPIAGMSTSSAGGFANLQSLKGFLFTVGIAIAMTTGYADGDTGAVAAGEIIANIGYQ